MKLYEIADKYRNALDALSVDAETGEISGIEQVDAVAGEFDEKLTACTIKIRELDNDSAFCAAEIARLRDIKKSVDKKRKWLAVYVADNMSRTGKRRIDDPRALAYLRASERVVVDAELPAEYYRVKTVREPDLTAVKKALKAGELVRGARIESGATLILQKEKSK